MSKFDDVYSKTINEVAPVLAAAARLAVPAVAYAAADKVLNSNKEEDESSHNLNNPAQNQQNNQNTQQNQQTNPQQIIKDLSSQFAKTNNPAEIEKMLNTPETKKALAAILTAK